MNRPPPPSRIPGTAGQALRTLFVSLVGSGAQMPLYPNYHVPKAETTQFLVTL